MVAQCSRERNICRQMFSLNKMPNLVLIPQDLWNYLTPTVHSGVPMWPLLMIHWTSLYRANLSPPNSSPDSPLWTSDMGPLAPDPWTPQPPWTSDMLQQPWPCPLLVTSGGHHWRPVQTCLLEDQPPPTPHPQWY